MSDDTVALRYDGPSPRVRVPAFGIEARPGEEIEADPDTPVPVGDDDDETQPLPEFLIERMGFERVRDYTDVLDGSVEDLEAALATGDYDARLDALAHAERENQNRKTALEAINERKEAD